MGKMYKGLLLVLVLIPSISFADTFEYGLLPVVGVYQSSLDIDSEVLAVGNALSGILIINSGRSHRYWIQGQYHSLNFDGTETQIGQQISGFEIASLYQSQYRISRHFKPWLGIGLSFAALEFKNRFLTDSQGFLAQTFKDETQAGMAIDLNFTTETDWFDHYDSGFALRISIPTNDVLGKFEAGFYITF